VPRAQLRRLQNANLDLDIRVVARNRGSHRKAWGIIKTCDTCWK